MYCELLKAQDKLSENTPIASEMISTVCKTPLTVSEKSQTLENKSPLE